MVITKTLRRFNIVILLSLIFVFFLNIDIHAVSFKFIWQNTTVEIPLGGSIETYKNVPYARLYKDGNVLSDANITYNTEGDWLYYFKDVNPYKVGTYQVWYKAYDSRYSPGTCTGYKALINFVVKDTEPPKIRIYEDTYKIRRGESYNLTNNFFAYDNYSLKETKVVETIDVNKIGDYKVTVLAIDSSFNQTAKSFIARVYEDSYPEIIYDIPGSILEVPLNSDFDYKSLFTAKDRLDGDITDLIEFSDFYNDRVMEYDLLVSVTNNANLTTKKKIHIIVEDLESPSIELSTNEVLLDYKTNFSSYDFTKYIKEIKDNEEIDYSNLEIEHNIKNKIGTYRVCYRYSDNNHVAEEDLDIVLLSYDKPTMYAEDIELFIGDKFDIYDYITIEDASDPNILESVELLDSNVDYDKEGTYYADLYCINSSGISNSIKVKINISKKSIFSSDNLSSTIFIIVLIVINLSLGIFLFYYFVIRRIKNKKIA